MYHSVEDEPANDQSDRMTLRPKVPISSLIIILTFCLGPARPCSGQTAAAVDARQTVRIEGTVTDFETGRTIPFATIQIEGSGQTTTANELGKFRLVLAAGRSYTLKCSHIAYYSEKAEVALGKEDVLQNFQLHPALIELPGTSVFDRVADPAEAIILEAIARKEAILAKLQDYQFDAYTKLVVRDRKKPDSINILLITETQLTCFWEQPDKYKEIITARRQTRNLKAESNLVTVGQILNFNRNRIEAGEMSIVSPTATDALDYYRYHLTDTTVIDSQRVFVLEIEPKTRSQTLFEGSIFIADSTFDVVAVDVGFSELESAFMINPRYSQRYARFENEYWLPVEIRFWGGVKLAAPIPGIPSELTFAHVASLNEFTIGAGIPDGTFGEIVLEIDEQADRADSSTWASRQMIPLTENEVRDGYERIDSIQAARSFGKKLLQTAVILPLALSTQRDLFHFNRVEGPYLGLATSIRKLVPSTELYVGGGYALDAELWQSDLRAAIEPLENWPLMIGAGYQNQAVRRPTIVHGSDVDMTLPALLNGSDPLDYHRQEGIWASVTSKIVNKTRMRVGYSDLAQQSIGANSNFSIFDSDQSIRANPPVQDGRLRSLSARFTYDSRPRLKNKGRVRLVASPMYTEFIAVVEHSTPELLGSDFEFNKYSLSLFRRQRTLDWGMSSLFVYWGAADRTLPPQRYFTVEYSPLDIHSGRGFKTLGQANFTGDRALAIALKHEFGRSVFARSGIPGLRALPFFLSVHGGSFWIDFTHQAPPDTSYGRVAKSAYSELGFSLGNLTPFLAPFNLTLGFTWQLSAYDTNRFNLSWGIDL